MWRAILGVIVGYIALAGTLIAAFLVGGTVLGVDTVFKPDSFEVSTTWIVYSFAVGAIAATLGGIVCAVIAAGPKSHYVFATLVLLGGIGELVSLTFRETPDPAPVRTADTTQLELMEHPSQPLWVAGVNPVIGVVGVLGGSVLIRGRRAPDTEATSP